MASRIRMDDYIAVVSGDHKGSRGKVLRILKDKNRVVIEGVNMVLRHVRRSKKHPQGGRIQKEAAIHLSNVMPIDPKTDKPTRVRFQTERGGDGKVLSKQRIAVSGTVIGDVTRAKQSGGE